VAIYAPHVDYARIAGFARFVGEAAAAGDKVALEILRQAGIELGTAACAVIKKLNLQRTKVPIGTRRFPPRRWLTKRAGTAENDKHF
jgi:N-acetylglucosamine kinase-like BadF-type ATPase